MRPFHTGTTLTGTRTAGGEEARDAGSPPSPPEDCWEDTSRVPVDYEGTGCWTLEVPRRPPASDERTFGTGAGLNEDLSKRG